MTLKSILIIALCYCLNIGQSQTKIIGSIQNDQGEAVMYANISLHSSTDSTLLKVEPSDESGSFAFSNIDLGQYFLEATYVGLEDFHLDIELTSDQEKNLGKLIMSTVSLQLEGATVTAKRAILEVKADRTVFNVQGTINSAGENAVELLRKAPGVLVDNNDNISVLGRSGVLIYVDGKRLPLTGDDLSAYLQNLNAEQIDRIDIISNPGAKYEAEGNAGIIDIRLKKDKNSGANGSLSGNISQGVYARGNINASGNYRNKKLNIFGNAGYNKGNSFNTIDFESYQNNLHLDEYNWWKNSWDTYDARVGTDFFLNDNHNIRVFSWRKKFTE